MDATMLSGCTGVYDRAALVALHEPMRARYVDHIYGQLSRQYRGLLLTLDYPHEQMDGPPFSLVDTEVQSLYSEHSNAELLDRRDLLDKQLKFTPPDLTRLHTRV